MDFVPKRASENARELSDGLRDAKREMDALSAAQKVLASTGDAVDVDTYRALSSEIEQASKRVNELASALVRTGQAGRDFAGDEAKKKQEEAAGDAARKKAADEETKRAKASEQTASAAVKQGREIASSIKGAGSATVDATSNLLSYGAALAGISGAAGLTKLAIGWRGAAQLQMVSYKAAMDLRRAVAGTDAQPLVRASAALERNLSKSTVTGSALSGLLTRGFNGLFSTIEKLEPVAEAVFQGMVLGGLEAEIAFQRVRATLAPVTVALEDAFENTDAMGTAAEGASGAFKGIAGAAESIASGIRDAYEWYQKLDAAMQRETHTPAQRAIEDRNDADKAAQEARDAARGGRQKEVYTATNGGKPVLTEASTTAGGGGEQTGKALSDGIIKGLDDGAAAVKAAGKRSAEEAVAGAREGADAHSPSRKTKRLGGDMTDGEVEGLDDGAPDVEKAARRALVPDVVAGAPGSSGARGAPGSSGSAAGASLSIGGIHLYFPGITSGAREAFEAVAGAPLLAGLREACIKLGLPIPGTTP